jgi:GNAT superfamily N-acetyltransferase
MGKASPRDPGLSEDRVRRLSRVVANLGLVHDRSGVRGLAELLLARSLPQVLAYERTAILASSTETRARLHPELDPRVISSPEPAAIELYERLEMNREPDVIVLGEDWLRRLFAAGQQLWIFSLEGRIAHLRWTGPGRLPLGRGALTLRPDERMTRGAVTVPDLRGRGVATAAGEHVRAVLASQGVTTLWGAVHCFNRAYLSGVLRGGYRRVGTVHKAVIGGHCWVRVSPASDTSAIDGRGVALNCWTRAR